MTLAPQRIGVFYSRGRNFAAILQSIRTQSPDARIVAVVPAGYGLSDAEKAAADHIFAVEPAAYGPRNPRAFLALIRFLRNQQFDQFVIIFDSPRLRVLAALVRAPQTSYCAFDQRLVTVRPHILSTLAGHAARLALGRLKYALVWLAIRLCPVRPPKI